MALSHVMEDVGASLSVKRTKKESATSSEILQAIALYPLKVYIFGSWYEGSSTIGLGSDIDNALVSLCFPVVTQASHFPRPISYLLIPDKHPGYVRLQLLHDGKPMFKGFGHHIDDKLYDLYIDEDDRLCLIQNLDDPNNLQYRTREGPALHEDAIGRIPTDTVYAVWCKSWPKVAAKWLTRRRKYNWPTPEMIHKYKSLGFVLVQACHPNSNEKKVQWRIAFSEQERSLVSQFNDTQHKCYVLLKVLKKEVIKKHLRKDSLTSYHFKTCMFYMLENTPTDCWIPENLVSCAIMCMRQMYTWVKKSNIPNYFIPRENMFDRVRDKEVKRRLVKLLEIFIRSDMRSVLESLESDLIGKRLNIYLTPTLNKSRSEEHLIQVASIDILLGDMMRARNQVLDRIPRLSGNMPRFTQDVTEYTTDLLAVLLIAGQAQITNHTEEETDAATSILIPFIKLSWWSCRVANCDRKEILDLWFTPKWCDMLDLIKSSANVKQVCAKFMLRYETTYAEELLSVTSKKFPFCNCTRFPPGRPNARELAQATEHRPNITAFEILRDYLQPCIVFLPFEKAITPLAIRYEMIRSYALPLLRDLYDGTFWQRWGVVAGRFLTRFLLYLIHKHSGQSFHCLVDITRMVNLLDSNSVCHRETCFNLLGWAYQDMGDQHQAVQCFRKSLQVSSSYNAAYWHLCFCICEKIN